jgi:ribose 5-phosphate isomerase B
MRLLSDVVGNENRLGRADHAGFELKEEIRKHLEDCSTEVDDRGTHSPDPVDYPDFARLVGEQVASGKADLGILVCGAGIGMSMAANNVPGIRAANVHSEVEAQLSREHNNGNVLALRRKAARPQIALKIVDRWLATSFAGGRHQQRVDKIGELEREQASALKAGGV